MKHTFASIFAAALLASSAAAAGSSYVELTGYSDIITCDTELTIEGTFYAKSEDETYVYGIALTEGVVTEGNATTLDHWTTADAMSSKVSTVANYFNSDPAYEGPFHYTGKIPDMFGLYDDITHELVIDPSKTYNVFAYALPGILVEFVNGKFMLVNYDTSLSDADETRLVTNTGKFPPDSSKLIPFVASKCSAQQLPTISSS